MSATTVYSYYDVNGIRSYIDDPELVKLGPWSSSGTYFGPPPYYAVNFGNSLYLAVENSIGQSPAIVTMPPRFWSPLVIVSEGAGTNEADEAIILAGSAIVLAGSAIALAGTAITIAETAFTIATSGSNLALEAWNLAQAGTIIPPLSTLPDVNIPSPTAGEVLTFDGSVWVAANPAPTVTTEGYVLFLDGTSTTPGYDQMRITPSALPETVVSAVTTGPPVLIDQFISGTIGRTVLDGGIWSFDTYARASKNKTTIEVKVFIQTFGSIETPLFDVITPTLPTSSTPGLVQVNAVGTLMSVDPSARLIARYYADSTAGGSVTVFLYHSGSVNYSNIITPLSAYHNNLAGLQGGNFNASEFYHLTAAQNTVVVSLAVGTVVGNLTVTGDIVTSNVQIGVGTVPAVTGTTVYDFTGPAYQQTTVDRNLIISGTNMAPGREIAVVLQNTGSTYSLSYPGAFTFYGTTPPASISNKNVLLALTSLSTTLSSVIGASSVSQ